MKYKKLLSGICLLITLFSCATMAQRDLSKIPEQIPQQVIEEPAPVQIEYKEKIVYVEKPVYVPLNQKPREEKKTGEEAVKDSVKEAAQNPDYFEGGMIFYDYDSTFAYNIYTRPLRITDIQLEPGEILSGQPVTGDAIRWIHGSGISFVNGIETQHIYLKPVKEGLETTMIINTNRRRYYLVLFSFTDVYMMGVCWNYPQNAMQQQMIIPKENTKGTGSAINLNNLCFDYSMSYPETNPPAWLPHTVFDDGAKTYVILPEAVLNTELPAVFLENGNIVNFKSDRNTLILERITTVILLKLNNATVKIIKKEKK